MSAAARTRATVTDRTRPVLPRHVKLRFDRIRQLWLLLAPERVLTPDDIAVEVLQLCDGHRRIDEITRILAGKYTAPVERIASDIIAMLQDLADKGFVTGERRY